MTARLLQGLFLSLVVLLGVTASMGASEGPLSKARQEAEAGKVEPVVIRMYNVQDLVLVRDFPFRSAVVPPTSMEALMPWAQYSAAQAGGGFGDLFGDATPQEKEELGRIATTLSPEVLVDLIMRTVAPESWDADPRVRIDRVGALLVVTQTQDVQRRIAELLEQFRTARPMVAIQARWVLLDDAQVDQVLAAAGPKRTVPVVVPAAALAAAKATVIYRGHITCFDRQTTHVASGRAQALMTDVEPVVAESAAGWDPTVNTLLWGALLEITPALAPDGQSVTLKVHSMVSEGKDVRTKTIEAQVGENKAAPCKAEVELPEFLIHTFRTTISAPLDKAVLVGGMTSPQAVDGKVLYLILEVSASGEAQGAPAPKPRP